MGESMKKASEGGTSPGAGPKTVKFGDKGAVDVVTPTKGLPAESAGSHDKVARELGDE